MSRIPALPCWIKEHAFTDDEEGHRDPLRSEGTLDAVADGLFRSGVPGGAGITSITNHLGYLAFHGWARSFVERVSPASVRPAYARLLWAFSWCNFFNLPKSEVGRRWIIYGVSRLRNTTVRGTSVPDPPHWQSDPEPLVVLDPWARYDGLWRSIPERERLATLLYWSRGFPEVQLRNLARGTSGKLANSLKPTRRLMSLSRLRPLQPIAQHLQDVRLSSRGIGVGLSSVRLGEILQFLARPKQPTETTAWMRAQLTVARTTHPIHERLRRAALARAIVYACNQTFYEWAFKQLGKDRQQREPEESTPKELLTQVSKALDSRARLALEDVEDINLDPGRFRLLEALEQSRRGTILDWVLNRAANAGKQYIERSATGWKLQAREQVRAFTGGYAGGLRLAQGWRIGKDVREAL